jgi:hypothetical protein
VIEVASSNEILRKRIRRLLRLDAGKDDPSELRTKILPFLSSLGEVALIGGAIRDVARLGLREFSSDLDFVVYESARNKFREAMLAANAKPNRFGGFGLRFHQWKVDVWHIEDTWARTSGLRKVEKLADLLRCTFFDWDSVVFDLRTGRLILDDDYLHRLKIGVMDVCLAENPNPSGSLVRALRRAALWQIRFGPELSKFSRDALSSLDWVELIERDKTAFGDAVLLYLDRQELIQKLDFVDIVDGIVSTFPVPNWARQRSLPFSQTEKTCLSPNP